jgi:hypothetical protein
MTKQIYQKDGDTVSLASTPLASDLAAMGAKGDKGDKGDTGLTGTTGTAGATGATGATGAGATGLTTTLAILSGTVLVPVLKTLTFTNGNLTSIV